MENPPKETAKDTFLHLLSAAMLYLSVIGFITLWWQIINFLVPDKLNPQGVGSWIYDTLIVGASMLVVAFPVHILISRIIGKDLAAYPQKRESQVRKWLWYITLFVSALTFVIDLMVVVYKYLKGDATAQFYLKSAVILVTAAAVFGYYLWDLKKKQFVTDKSKKIAIIAAVVIAASVIYGFSVFGSPASQRNMRFDEQRVSDLQQIQFSVADYWQQKQQLPASLTDLSVLGYYGNLIDPETGSSYEYTVKGDLSFELCATFKTVFTAKDSTTRQGYVFPATMGVATVPQNWVHEGARSCFESTIDPAFFKNQTTPESVKNRMLP